MGTPFPLNFLCGKTVPMRSRPTTPLIMWNIGKISMILKDCTTSKLAAIFCGFNAAVNTTIETCQLSGMYDK